MENIEIAAILKEMATLLEIQGETNPFRIRAYRNAVYTIEESPDPIRKMVEEGEDLTELPAIGKDMASHITELVTTGRLSILDEVSKEVPRSLVELTKLPGVGPKKVRKLGDELDITAEMLICLKLLRVPLSDDIEKLRLNLAKAQQPDGSWGSSGSSMNELSHHTLMSTLALIEFSPSFRGGRNFRCVP